MNILRNKLVAAGLIVAAVLATATGAHAQYVDPTAGAADDLSTGITDFITNVGLPALVVVLVLGVIVGVLVKYAKKMRAAS